jgi:hypothetical protein
MGQHSRLESLVVDRIGNSYDRALNYPFPRTRRLARLNAPAAQFRMTAGSLVLTHQFRKSIIAVSARNTGVMNEWGKQPDDLSDYRLSRRSVRCSRRLCIYLPDLAAVGGNEGAASVD